LMEMQNRAKNTACQDSMAIPSSDRGIADVSGTKFMLATEASKG